MHITDLSKFPEGEVYAILTIKSVHISGDERSRTAPGHGYPAHTETHPSLQTFTSEAEWRAEIADLMYPTYGYRKEFKAFIIKPVEISAKVEVIIT